MFYEKYPLREVAIEAISDIAQHLPLDCQMFLIICRPGKLTSPWFSLCQRRT